MKPDKPNSLSKKVPKKESNVRSSSRDAVKENSTKKQQSPSTIKKKTDDTEKTKKVDGKLTRTTQQSTNDSVKGISSTPQRSTPSKSSQEKYLSSIRSKADSGIKKDIRKEAENKKDIKKEIEKKNVIKKEAEKKKDTKKEAEKKQDDSSLTSSNKTRIKKQLSTTPSRIERNNTSGMETNRGLRSHKEIIKSRQEKIYLQKERIESKKQKSVTKQDEKTVESSGPQHSLMTPRQRTWTKEDAEEILEKKSLEIVNRDIDRETTVDVSKGAINKENLDLENRENISKKDSLEMGPQVTGGGDTDDFDYEYEDDFEDYESDFEEDLSESGLSTSDPQLNLSSESETETDFEDLRATTSKPVEEERKLDSGNYDLSSKPTPQDSMKQIEEQEEKVYSSAFTKNENSSPCKQQEKLEKKRHEEKTEEISDSLYKHNIYDFSGAAKQKKMRDAKHRSFTRGKQLLSMIQLQPSTYQILDMPSLPYDIFMKCYGKSNMCQVHIQTNENNPTEEVQTDSILTKNKWTQHPIKFHNWSNNNESMLEFIEDRQGTGGDKKDPPEDMISQRRHNKQKLNKFINSAAEVMCILLEENNTGGDSDIKKVEKDYGFSDGYIPLCIEDIDVLKDKKITIVSFSPHHPYHLVTAHSPMEDMDKESIDKCKDSCALTLWNILEPSQPLKIMTASLRVTSICFDALHMKFFYAGHFDGSIYVWDLSENSMWHKQSSLDRFQHTLRKPAFCTSTLLKDSNHLNSIVSIKSIGYKSSNYQLNSDSTPTQIISMDENGKINIWTVIQEVKSSYKNKFGEFDLGMAPWSTVKLVCSASVHVKDIFSQMNNSVGLQLQCLEISPGNEHSVLLGTNFGLVGRWMLSGILKRPQIFKDHSDEVVVVNCITSCPRDLPIFLVGCSNGKIRVHSLSRTVPLIVLFGNGNGVERPIQTICWSAQKPGLFIVAEKKYRLHLWDMCKGDFYPQFTVPLSDNEINGIALTSSHKKSYLAVVTDKLVQVHALKKEYTLSQTSLDEMEFKKFSLYISIL